MILFKYVFKFKFQNKTITHKYNCKVSIRNLSINDEFDFFNFVEFYSKWYYLLFIT